MKFNTKTIHGGQSHDPAYGAVMPPFIKPPRMPNLPQEVTRGMNIPAHTTPLEMLWNRHLRALKMGAMGWHLAAVWPQLMR